MIPQTTFVFETENLSETENPIFISFTARPEVRKTTVDVFSLQESLNFLGSNLGLWPGMGLYQILELFVGMLFGSKIVTEFVKLIKGNK